jgi:ubiquinone/menaquinone biosynthesis C-methylase UbiE
MTSDAKRYTRAIFDQADDYDRDVGFFAAFGAQLVERSGVGPGDRVLDLCCGRGASLVPAAHAVGRSGGAIGVDLSPEMVRRSNEALTAEGLGDRALAQVGDIDTLEFDDASFDAVHCGFGVFFAEDVPAMLAGVHRVLRANGRFVFSLFAGPPLWPWLVDVIVRHAEPVERAEHPMWTASGAVDQLHRAGFAEPDHHTITETVLVPSIDVLWTQLWSLGTRPLLEQMDDTTQRLVRSQIAERLEEHRVAGGYASTSAATVLVAGRGA